MLYKKTILILFAGMSLFSSLQARQYEYPQSYYPAQQVQYGFYPVQQPIYIQQPMYIQQPLVNQAPLVVRQYRSPHEEKNDSLYPQQKQYLSALYEQQAELERLAKRDKFIWFYKTDNPLTYFLSNYYPSSVYIGGMRFLCAEAAYQAAKYFHRPDLVAQFTQLDGEQAWQLANKLKYQRRTDWFQVRESLMQQVVRAKFQQNPMLTQLLLSTRKAYLVKHSSRDRVWGDGGDGEGKNQLGFILMEIRKEMGGSGIVSIPSKYRKFVR
jgi:ribA/ribD-fused uncharacterized protein